MKKISVSDAIILHLLDRRGEWVKSYELEQRWFHGKFTGIAATRRMREIAETGLYTLNGVKYFVERRQKGKYAEYRVVGGEKLQKKVEYLDNGSVRIKQEVLKL